MFRKRTPPTLPPEWLIVGLGNPGPQYAGTRHNVGFDLIERLADAHRIQVRTAKHRALMGAGMVAGIPVALAKPLTFMNLSGQSVAPLARSYGIPPERILVVADDMDLALGRLRLRGSGGSGGHNGHKSLIASLGTQDYPRLRIGIGKDEAVLDHVLSKFHPDERPVVDEVLKKAVGVVERLLTDGLERATEQAALA
ncbi:MAG: peptidyl-tRNA hydrolase [Chthonomonas sp.]